MKADVTETRIERVRLVPVRLNLARVDLATGAESKAIADRMIDRCAALGTRAVDVAGTLSMECSAVREAAAVT